MPVYTFRCRKCGQITRVEHGFWEHHPVFCLNTVQASIKPSQPAEVDEDGIPYHPQFVSIDMTCGGELERIFDSPSIIYRGSGFYHTDKGLYKTMMEEKREAAEGEL